MTEFNYQHERELLDKWGKQLEQMRAEGKENTEEYECLSDEWQSLAHDLIMAELLDEEE